MNRQRYVWLAFPFLWLTSAVLADRETIGSIEAVIDGEKKTWHIIADDGNAASTGALWTIPESGSGETALAVIGGFESTDIVINRDPETGNPSISGEGSQISINFEFPIDASSTEVTLPGAKSASVLLMPTVGDYSVMHGMEEGTISVSQIDVDKTAPSRFEGTFSGQLVSREGEALGTISDGRFEVDGAEYFKAE